MRAAAIFVVAGAVSGHQNGLDKGQIPWTLATYPDPLVNLDRCGRGHPSQICDPELLLDPKVLDGLDEQIHKAGVPLELAVLGEVSGTAFDSWNLDDGFHAFASHLAHDWGVLGKERPGIFLLYSVSDDFIDIRPDEKVRIDHGVLRHIARTALRSSDDPNEVVRNLVQSVLQLWGDEDAAESLLTIDRSRLLFYLLTCSLGVVAMLLVACFAYDIFSHWRHQARFRLCKSKVEKIHEAFGKRHENLPLCPICIEALPNVETTKACPHAVTFLCGHRFHTDCANSWFMFNDAPGRCPICELPHTYSVKAQCDGCEAGTLQVSDEIKAFFLTSLRARFPEIVSETKVDAWRGCHTEIWLAELQPRRYNSIWSSWRG